MNLFDNKDIRKCYESDKELCVCCSDLYKILSHDNIEKQIPFLDFCVRADIAYNNINSLPYCTKKNYNLLDLVRLPAYLLILHNLIYYKYKAYRIDVRPIIRLYIESGYSQELFEEFVRLSQHIKENSDTSSSIIKLHLNDIDVLKPEKSPRASIRNAINRILETLCQKPFLWLEVHKNNCNSKKTIEKYYAPYIYIQQIYSSLHHYWMEGLFQIIF